MQHNLKTIAKEEFGLGLDRIIFSNKVPRDEHLRRLCLADLFLDTPAYNAHTTGCDSLIAGVPMVSLLRNEAAPRGEVETDKMPSRVGASFLITLGLDELVASTMPSYEDMMVRCANDHQFIQDVTNRLRLNRHTHSLFDMEQWVNAWEEGLEIIITADEPAADLHVCDQAQ